MRRRLAIIGSAAALLGAPAAFAQEAAAPTFSADIAPIVYAKCAGCHHPGEAAPFSLLTYDDVKKRSRQIVDVTQKHFMPPWMPSGEGVFLGERRLTDRELKTISDWAEAGAPQGDPNAAPRAPEFTDGWQTGTPDLILESPAYSLAPQGGDVFRNFVVPIKLDSPKWIESIELRPENPRVTHHARLGVDSSNESVRRDAEDPEPGYAGMAWGQDPDGQLVIWAPGMVASRGTPGVAWRLYPQTCLVLHTHMQPSGKAEVVKFRIGVHFAKEAPTSHPVMMRIGSCDIDIPAGAARHVVSDEYLLPIDVDVQTVFPHAHSLCTSMSVVAVGADGKKETVIEIPRFDENWHDSYRFIKPMRVRKGTRLVTTYTYDNTDGNIRNRNHPAKRVVYGSSVMDEMADVYLQVTAARPEQREVLMEDYKKYELRAQITGHRKTLEMHPEDVFGQEALATYLVGAGDAPGAIRVLEKRLSEGKAEVFPVVSLGMALLAKGDAAGAEAQMRRATGMDGEYPLAWLGLGKALMAEKKNGEAEQALKRAGELAPGLMDAHLGLADLLVMKGDLDAAAAACTDALQDSPEAAAIYMKLGEIRAREGKWAESLESFSKARELAPYTHPAKVLLGVFCCSNGDVERGEKLLKEARAEWPRHPMSGLVLGQLAIRRQDWKGAKEYLEAAAALPLPDEWPESHAKRFEVLLQTQRCRVAEQLQDEGMARDALKRWLRVEPGNERVKGMLEGLGG